MLFRSIRSCAFLLHQIMIGLSPLGLMNAGTPSLKPGMNTQKIDPISVPSKQSLKMADTNV